MNTDIRLATISDSDDCGRIIYNAFKKTANDYGFPCDFPSLQFANLFSKYLISSPSIFCVAAEVDKQVVGVNFLHEKYPIRSVGPICIDAKFQGQGIGRRLMEFILERAKDNPAGIRLVQDAFNITSMSLYTSLGFEIKETLVLMNGSPTSGKIKDHLEIHTLKNFDLNQCASLCQKVNGFDRVLDLEEAQNHHSPFIVKREGRITGYAAAMTNWMLNHCVGETEEDMKAMILGIGKIIDRPLSFLLPTRHARLFRWCLNHNMRLVKPLTLMGMGPYQNPRGFYFPSATF